MHSIHFITIFYCLLYIALTPVHSFAKSAASNKKFWTYPMPPRLKATSPLSAKPAYEVPDPFDGYTFKTTEITPQKPTGKIPLFEFDFRGRRKIIGEIGVGQPIKPDGIRRFSAQIYYSFQNNNQTMWISGKALGVDGFTLPGK